MMKLFPNVYYSHFFFIFMSMLTDLCAIRWAYNLKKNKKLNTNILHKKKCFCCFLMKTFQLYIYRKEGVWSMLITNAIWSLFVILIYTFLAPLAVWYSCSSTNVHKCMNSFCYNNATSLMGNLFLDLSL